MVDLARWLGTQLDEDERITRAARDAEFCKDGRWVVKGPFEEGLGSIHSDAGEAVLGEEESVPFAIADHITRHDPARVLREIDVDRELLAEYERLLRAHEAHRKEADRLAQSADDDPFRRNALRREADYLPAMLHVMERWAKRKAAVYADRPGFREEWSP